MHIEGNYSPISLLHHANLLGPSDITAILVAITLFSPFGSALTRTKDMPSDSTTLLAAL
ncbi:hypothetical protein M433DRAFT_9378 [Acidomyces richmondensis BFW]|nr:MAG: hypothetical protein FE78DRAFT_41964 [Acidomyces sp. 'richmondensis']KYG40038.1 hypothetical protein M433DRAFT_9378 [Acidomyces richmondensis BFW]